LLNSDFVIEAGKSKIVDTVSSIMGV